MKIGVFIDIEDKDIKSTVESLIKECSNEYTIQDNLEEAWIIFTDKQKTFIEDSIFILSPSKFSTDQVSKLIIRVFSNFENSGKLVFPYLFVDPKNMEFNRINFKSLLSLIKNSLCCIKDGVDDIVKISVLFSNRLNEEAFEEIIFKLSSFIENKDGLSKSHVKRVALYCKEIAESLGLPSQYTKRIYLASFLHDIGKIAIPDSILLKSTRLSEDEFEIVKKHTLIGAQILANSDNPIIKLAESISMSHHEKYNGKGYPLGLKGEEIPLEGRIVAIADVFDILTSRRPYKEPCSIEEAIREIRNQINEHFCPYVAKAFLRSIKRIVEIKYCVV